MKNDLKNLQKIEMDLIRTNPNQPRKHFDEESLIELSESIKSDGLMSPIMVRPLNGTYEIVQGERRYRAAKLAGIAEIQAFVEELNDDDAFHLSVIENIQREQMTPIEEANAFMKYVENGYTHEQIAKKVNKDRTFITSRLRMLQLLPELQDWIAERRISHGHVTQLLKYEAILNRHIGRNVSTRPVQKLFMSIFEDKSKISVNDVINWGENMRWHFLIAIVGTFNGRGETKIWNKHRSIKSFCGDYHLHIKTITPEDLEFLAEWDISHSDQSVKKSEIYRVYEDLESKLFNSELDINGIWDSQNVYYLGEKTLEQIEDSIKGYLDTIENSRNEMIKAYREAAENASLDEDKKSYLESANKLESMSDEEFMEYCLDGIDENVSRDTKVNG
ncbi:ParB/RepB/Spo0J family partition protein [Sporosarcina saromensis]|uniref:ParB/RepB/Spo0J family partition protein n=1 Tax=Sporosarcina saromensis TaxID=359365 RepID=A0ABU4G5E7_9BACL|nr:ParB/RepB/Spo0J family partition protein [Sporosarcina saromensis]MDW0112184.1 ParB/RepB/Spo0J family partition protein [Sporosarcina saromensis]